MDTTQISNESIEMSQVVSKWDYVWFGTYAHWLTTS